jgi:hypothetical protein
MSATFRKMADIHVMWVPAAMACPWIVDGVYGLQIWRVAMNTLNKQFWTADKGWFPSLGVRKRD